MIAIGQAARGVFVLGQVAIGFVGLGQAAFVVFGAGQVGAGVMGFTAMLGVGGRGYGGVLRLLPGFDPPRKRPVEVPYEDVVAGRASGPVRLDVLGQGTGVRLGRDGHALPIKLTPKAAGALVRTNRNDLKEVYAVLKKRGNVLVGDRLIEVPGSRKAFKYDGFFALRMVAFVGLAIAWCMAFAASVVPWDLM